MRYFKNITSDEVFGYDLDQVDLISEAEGNSNMQDITGSWPPAVDPVEVKAEEARHKRNYLLSQSDWTQVADAPVDQVAWANYRQELRDVPQQPGFPDNVIWPTKP